MDYGYSKGGDVPIEILEREDIQIKLNIKALSTMFRNYLGLGRRQITVRYTPFGDDTQITFRFMKFCVDEELARLLEKLTSYAEVPSPDWPTIGVAYYAGEWNRTTDTYEGYKDEDGLPSIMVELVLTFDNEDLKDILGEGNGV
jgi:hypothetical protein